MDDFSAKVVGIQTKDVRESSAITSEQDVHGREAERADFIKVEVKEEELTECTGICLAASEAARLRAELHEVQATLARGQETHERELAELRELWEVDRAALEETQEALNQSVAARNNVLQEVCQQRTRYESVKKVFGDLLAKMDGEGPIVPSMSPSDNLVCAHCAPGGGSQSGGEPEGTAQSGTKTEEANRPLLIVDEPPLSLGEEAEATKMLSYSAAMCGIAEILVWKSDFVLRTAEPDIAVFMEPSHYYDGVWERNSTLSDLLGKRKELFVRRYTDDVETLEYAGTYDVTKVFREISDVPDRTFEDGRSLWNTMWHSDYYVGTWCMLAPELRNIASKERAVKARITQGLAWAEYALLQRVGVNAALYNSLKRYKERGPGEGQEVADPAVVINWTHSSDSSRSRSKESGVDGRRPSKRRKLESMLRTYFERQ